MSADWLASSPAYRRRATRRARKISRLLRRAGRRTGFAAVPARLAAAALMAEDIGDQMQDLARLRS
jgi:hypothetical protein